MATSGSSASPYTFAATSGYRNDGDAGLAHVGARYYDAQVGRFITCDTELDQHPYLYCDHDPVNALDPSGHIPFHDIGSLVGTYVGGLIGGLIGGGIGGWIGGAGALPGAMIGGGVGSVVGGIIGGWLDPPVPKSQVDQISQWLWDLGTGILGGWYRQGYHRQDRRDRQKK